ncbi:MAG: hypothetical protein CMP39_06110 [Rickettsiales bacterium]|nr:hypothetical protein [Rickettsiales bacterium]
MTNLKRLFKDITSFEASLLSIGHRTFHYVSEYPNQYWPAWLNKQLFEKTSNYDINNNIKCLNNTRFRNWIVLSEPNIDDIVSVDPYGLTHIKHKHFSIQFVFKCDSVLFTPNEANEINQQFNPTSSSLRTTFSYENFDIVYDIIFKSSINNFHLALQKYKIINRSSKPISCSFLLLLSPYNFEGLTSVKKIDFIRHNTFMVNHSIGLICDEKPQNIVCSNYKDGDFESIYSNIEMILSSQCKNFLASSFVEYTFDLNEGEEKILYFKAPSNKSTYKPGIINKKNNFSNVNLECSYYESLDYNKQLKLKVAHLAKETANLLQIELPDKDLVRLFNQNILYLKNFIGENNIQSGFYFDYFKTNLNDSNIFLSLIKISYPIDFHKFFPSEQYLKEIEAKINEKIYTVEDICRWLYNYLVIFENLPANIDINSQLKKIIKLYKTIIPSKPYFINKRYPYILPPREAKKYGSANYFLTDMLWYLIVAKKIHTFLDSENLAKENEINWVLKKFPELINSFIVNSFRKDYEKDLLPVSSITNKSIKLFDTLESMSKLPEYENDYSKLYNSTLSYIETNLLHKGLLLSISNPTGYLVEQNFRLIKYYAEHSSEKAYSTLKNLVQLAGTAGTWPDCVHPVSLGGSYTEGHCSKSAALFIDSTLKILFNDSEESCLEFFPGFPKSWFLDYDNILNLKNATSRYGQFSVQMTKEDNKILFDFKHSFWSKPKYFLFNLPSEVKSVSFNNRSLARKGSKLKIPFNISKIQFNLNDQIKNK